jgi:hypothetical protein
MKKPAPPKALDAMVAVVLAYRPKPKTQPARKRQRTRRRLEVKKNLLPTTGDLC